MNEQLTELSCLSTDELLQWVEFRENATALERELASRLGIALAMLAERPSPVLQCGCTPAEVKVVMALRAVRAPSKTQQLAADPNEESP